MMKENNSNTSQDSLSSSRWKTKYNQIRVEKEALVKKVSLLIQQLQKNRTRCIHLEEKFNERNNANHFDIKDGCGDEKDTRDISTINNKSCSWTVSCMQKKVRREEQDFIGELQSRNSILQRDQKILQGKYKNSTQAIKKFKQQLQTLRRRYGANSLPHYKSVDTGGCQKGVSDEDQYDADMRNMLGQVQKCLLESEAELRCVTDENKKLKKENNASLSYKNSHLLDHKASNKDEELDEARADFKSLRIQYTTLESKSLAQSQIHNMTLIKLQECNVYMHRLHYEIQALRNEKEVAAIDMFKAEDKKAQVQELTEQNEFLEERLAKLCELPFLHEDATETNNLSQQIIDLEIENTDYQNQVEQLQIKHKQDEHSIDSLRSKCDKLTDHCSVLVFQLKESKDAVMIEKRRTIDKDSTSSKDNQQYSHIGLELINIGIQVDVGAHNITHDIYRQPECSDLQRVQQLLDAQVVVNDDLNKRLQLAATEIKDGKVRMESRAHDYYILAIQRLQRIRLLEEFIMHKDSKNSGTRHEDMLCEMATDETVMQISVHDTDIPNSSIGGNDRSVVVLNLLNFEPQVTPICIGHRPCFNFTTNFTMKINAFMMQQINTRHLQIEYYVITPEATFELKAHTAMTISQLMYSNDGESSHRLCLRHAKSDSESVFGYINIAVRLAQPLNMQKLMKEWRYDEIFTDAFSIQDIADRNERVNEAFDNTSQNHLEVILSEVTSLTEETNKHLYVRYQLLGFTDTFTNIVDYDTKKETHLQHRSLIPILVSRPFISALRGGRCEFKMYHSNQGETTGKDQFTLLGTGGIDLVTLANGQAILNKLKLKSTNGARMGNLSVSIRWSHQSKLIKALNVNANLDNEILDVETVLEEFSDGATIRYIDFLRCVDPPYPIFKIIDTMQDVAYSSEEKISELKRALGHSDSHLYVTYEQFVTVVTEFGAPSIQREEVRDLYCYIDVLNEKRMLSDHICFYLFSAGIQQLREKIFALRGTSISVREPFKIADQEKIGSISKESCLQCLRSSGIIKGGKG